MDATMKVTKSEILRIARKKFGKHVELEERKGAPTPEERLRLREESIQRRERINAINARVTELKFRTKDLAAAARFVVDVDGDQPSIPKLSQELARAEEYLALVEEKRELEDIGRKKAGLGLSNRWNLWEIVKGPFLHRSQIACADTLEQLYEKLESK